MPHATTYLTAFITFLWASDDTFATYRSTSISAGDFITRLKANEKREMKVSLMVWYSNVKNLKENSSDEQKCFRDLSELRSNGAIVSRHC